MSASGVLAFENDDAFMFTRDLMETVDLSVVESAFDAVADCGDYLEAPDASYAIAACEVVARLKGRNGYKNQQTAKVDAWVAEHRLLVPPELATRAVEVLDRILSPSSELKELFEEGDAEEWIAAVKDLRQRVMP